MAVLIMNSADDPISESKALDGMVIYHLSSGSILIVGGFLAESIAGDELYRFGLGVKSSSL